MFSQKVYWLTKDWGDDSENTRNKIIIPYFANLGYNAGFSLVSNGCRTCQHWKVQTLVCSRRITFKNKVVSVLHCAVVFGLCLWLIFPLLFLHSNICRVSILLEKERQRVVDRMMLKIGALFF